MKVFFEIHVKEYQEENSNSLNLKMRDCQTNELMPKVQAWNLRAAETQMLLCETLNYMCD